MLKALDELVYARYNGCSWLIYNSTATPQIPTGYVFKFGTLQNLREPAGTVTYSSADETPNSSSLFLQKYSPETNVIFVSNALPVTLNRQTVSVGGTNYYLGIDSQPERFERLRLVDILVENYTDPVAGNNTTFTFRNHWTRFGSVRIHNGNRFPLTVNFQDTGGTVTVPAYGIVTARRTYQTGSFTVDSTYLPITKAGDRMSYQANYSGQCAAEMETAYSIMASNDWLRYSGSLPDYDTTSRETASFVGTAPAAAQRWYDWVIHQGDVLSVLWNKETNNVTRTILRWNGLNTGFTPTGFVNIAWRANDFMLSSNGEAIFGHTNYEHDIIPISTNLNGTEIFSIYPDPGTGYGKQFNRPVVEKWTHLQKPLELGAVTATTITTYSPYYGGAAVTYPRFEFVNPPETPTLYSTLGTTFPDKQAQEGISGISSIYSTFTKTNGAIGKHSVIELTSSITPYADFTSDLLTNNTFTEKKAMRWDTVSSWATPRTRQRFVPFSTRIYQDRYSELDSNGHANFLYHPQDGEISGSLDKSGSQQIMDMQPFEETDIMIDGSDFTKGNSTHGMKVYYPTTNLYYILNNIYRDGWWQANRTDLYRGITEQQKRISWRLPRLIEHLNDLVKAINNVAEVYPVSLEKLYYKPLPAGCKQLPFSIGGETPFAVPADWVLGKYDTSGEFRTWCIYWGISYVTTLPNWETLKSYRRKFWAYSTINRDTAPAGKQVSGHEMVDISVLDPDEAKIGSTAPGIVYQRKYALQAWYHRQLFGGASTPLEYVYVTKANLTSAIGSLNIHLTKVPAGERYTPSFAYDTTLTKLAGTYYTDAPFLEYRYILTEPYNPSYNDAYSFYIKTESSGTWIQRVDDYTPFRLSEQTTTSKRRFYQGQTIAGGTIQWLVNERTEDANTIEAHWRSARYLAPQSEAIIENYGSPDEPAYQTLTEINSEVPFLLVCGPETYYTHQWDTIGEYTAIIPETYTPVVPTGTLFFKEIAVADMPVTVAKIKSWSGQDWPVWHCQIVRRNGVLRV